MKSSIHLPAVFIAFLLPWFGQPAMAGFDKWQINEIFSSADGSIQFIELFTSAADQQDLSGRSLVAKNAAGLLQNLLELNSNLTGSTANKTVLIATQAFASITGLTPDYLMSPGFLFTSGGSLNFANGTAVLSYQANQLPLNGVQSINASLAPATATPRTFANGLTATIAAPVRASFSAASSILNLPVVSLPGVGVANMSFNTNLQSIQFELRSDFYLYGSGIVAGSNAAQLLPGNVLQIPALPIGNELYAFKMSVVNSNPLIFGNLSEVFVSSLNPGSSPSPAPAPTPQPTALQQSFDKGRSLYSQLCTSCHGASGNGVTAPSLVSSGLSDFAALRQRIDLTMPLNAPASCRDSATSACATDVANFILNVLQQTQTDQGEPPAVGPY